MGQMTAIEKIKPGMVLEQDILDAPRVKVVYSKGTRLNAEMINNILSLDYLEVDVNEAAPTQTAKTGDGLPVRSYKPGDFIFFQGESATELFILKKGVLQVMTTETNPPYTDLDKAKRFVGENGKIISQIRGEMVKFGEMAAILKGLRSASIRCCTEVEVAVIPTNEQAFKKTLLANPKLGISIAATLAGRLKKIEESVTQIHKIYETLTKKIHIYQTVFLKIKTSLEAKRDTTHHEWLDKIIKEMYNIPSLSDPRKFRTTDVERKIDILEMKDMVLPPEMEHQIRINSWLSLKDAEQTNFFMIAKGKVEMTSSDGKITVLSTPGTFLEHIIPLSSNMKKYKGKHLCDIKSLTPLRCFKIEVEEFEKLCTSFPNLALFLCKSLSHQLIQENLFVVSLLEVVDRDLSLLAIGDTNFRRGFKRLHKLIQKFSKDEALTKPEETLAATIREQVDTDYGDLKDQLNRIYLSQKNE